MKQMIKTMLTWVGFFVAPVASFILLSPSTFWQRLIAIVVVITIMTIQAFGIAKMGTLNKDKASVE